MNTTVNFPVSARATHPAPTVSGRYQFISTQEIVARCAQEGWQVASATHARTRSRDGAYSKHMLDLRHPDHNAVHGSVPRIIVINSHDGSGSARVAAGLYRFVCSNGLIVGTTIDSAVVRHTGDAAANLIHRVQTLARETQTVYGKIESWAKKDLTRPQREAFARFAAQLRWGDARRFEVEELLQVRRAEDDGGDLWRTFNRVQENTMRGGLQGLSRSGRAATSRPLSDITRSVQFNADLWQLAEEVATTW